MISSIKSFSTRIKSSEFFHLFVFQSFGEQSSDTGVSTERRAAGHEGGEEQTAGTVS